jgi:hypothetical protein
MLEKELNDVYDRKEKARKEIDQYANNKKAKNSDLLIELEKKSALLLAEQEKYNEQTYVDILTKK